MRSTSRPRREVKHLPPRKKASDIRTFEIPARKYQVEIDVNALLDIIITQLQERADDGENLDDYTEIYIYPSTSDGISITTF